MVELLGRRFELVEHLEHVLVGDLAGLNECEQECLMRDYGLLQSELHEEVARGDWLSKREVAGVLFIGLLDVVVDEQRGYEEVLDGLEVREGVVLVGRGWLSPRRVVLLLRYAFVVLARTLLEEHLAQHLLLLLVGVVVLHVVVAGRVEHGVVVVVAVGVAVAHLLVERVPLLLGGGARDRQAVDVDLPGLVLDLGGQQKHALVETADHRDLHGLLAVGAHHHSRHLVAIGGLQLRGLGRGGHGRRGRGHSKLLVHH